MKRDTKQAIASKFRELVSESSLDKIRIGDLISTLSINRNTFYYHFNSKYDIAFYCFRHDISNYLRSSLPDVVLVCRPLESKNEDPIELPYYTHIETGARMLDSSKFPIILMNCIHDNEEFYSKLFTREEPEFLNWIYKLYYPAIKNDLEFVLAGRFMFDEAKQLLCDTLTNTLISSSIFCLNHPKTHEIITNEKKFPYWNNYWTGLHEAIKNHPVNKSGSDINSIFFSSFRRH